MTRRAGAIVLVACALVALCGAQTATDLSGIWTLDAARSSAAGGGRGAGGGNPTGGQGGGLGLGPTPTQLTITQTAASLTVEELRGETTAHMVYALGPTKSSNVVPAGRSAGQKITTTSSWKNGTLVTTYALPGPPDNEGRLLYQEVRSLDRDGALIVETTIAGQPNLRRSVYVKKKIPLVP